MGGLLILVLLGLYVWIAYRLILRSKKLWMKALVLLLAVLIPTADAVYERLTFQALCEREAGLKLFRIVEGVDGFRSNEGEPSDEWLKQGRFKFVESSITNGLVTRKSVVQNGGILSIAKVTSVSLYEYAQRTTESSAYLWQFRVIRTTNRDEELGLFVNIIYRGGWVERAIGSIFASRGSVSSCSDPSYEDKVRLVLAVLKPSK